MNAKSITLALSGKWHGNYGSARCPCHNDRSPSLSIRDGESMVVFHCFAGCSSADIVSELRRRLGLLDGAQGQARQYNDRKPQLRWDDERDESDAARTVRALTLWHEAKPETLGTMVELYLLSRHIHLADLPSEARTSLRFHPRCPHPSGVRLPAMIALVEHVERGAVAIHRTFLRSDGSGKADIEPAKASLGPVGGVAVCFGQPRVGEQFPEKRRFGIAEGIETALAVAQSCNIPMWAALSATGMSHVVLPHEASHVVICADHDSNGVGQRAARNASQRFFAEGRRSWIARLPQPDTDFADMLVDSRCSSGAAP